MKVSCLLKHFTTDKSHSNSFSSTSTLNLSSTMRFFAILPLLLPAVLAREHKQCDCSVKTWNSNMHYDWQLTFNVCKDSFGATVRLYNIF